AVVLIGSDPRSRVSSVAVTPIGGRPRTLRSTVWSASCGMSVWTTVDAVDGPAVWGDAVISNWTSFAPLPSRAIGSCRGETANGAWGSEIEPSSNPPRSLALTVNSVDLLWPTHTGPKSTLPLGVSVREVPSARALIWVERRLLLS